VTTYVAKKHLFYRCFAARTTVDNTAVEEVCHPEVWEADSDSKRTDDGQHTTVRKETALRRNLVKKFHPGRLMLFCCGFTRQATVIGKKVTAEKGSRLSSCMNDTQTGLTLAHDDPLCE
jgi:hypothetical protein